jgi:hypothetical protein
VVEVLHTMHGIVQGVHLEKVAFHPLDPLKPLSTVRMIMLQNPLDDGRIAAFPQQCAHASPLRQQRVKHVCAYNSRSSSYQIHLSPNWRGCKLFRMSHLMIERSLHRTWFSLRHPRPSSLRS